MLVLGVLLVAMVTVPGCLGADLVQTLSQDSKETTLVSLVTQAGLASDLSSGNFTIFAPTNAAFAKVPQDTLDDLKNHPDKLAQLLKYHVVPGVVTKSQAQNDVLLDSLNGAKIRVNIYRDRTTKQQTVTVEGAVVTDFDHKADNGVIHVIDHVMMPPTLNVVDAVVADPDLSSLLSAVQTAGLADNLKHQTSLTLFAPSNAAFSKLDSRLLNHLMANPDKLKELLLYHVAPKTVFSAGLHDLSLALSEDSKHEPIIVKHENGVITLYYGGAHVTRPDIVVTNGVIHVIDTVLVPFAMLHDVNQIIG